jgi:hypothetical protein
MSDRLVGGIEQRRIVEVDYDPCRAKPEVVEQIIARALQEVGTVA